MYKFVIYFFLQCSVLKKYGLIHFYVTTSKLLQYCLPIQLTFLVMMTMFEVQLSRAKMGIEII